MHPLLERIVAARGSHLIVGGAPAGIKSPPGESGCLTNRTSIKIMTTHGKMSTIPNGTEMRELPLSRMRLFKKLNRGVIFSVVFEISSNLGIAGVEGKRFLTF